jgi:SAM-dependent methyltransferase
MGTEQADVDRLRAEYANREHRLLGSDIYSPFNPAHLFALQMRQQAELSLLRRNGFFPLHDRQILEVGCGAGGVLLNYLSYGAQAQNLFGVDLLPNRVEEARRRLPNLAIECVDSQHLPYPPAAFDLVMQYTVFSSVLDDGVRANVAHEMLRVVKPSGMILWYDFWLNPTNRETRGIRAPEIRRLFPGCRCEFRRVTLAPPIARRLVQRFPLACYVMEGAKLLSTHLLVAIRPS